MTKQLNTAIPSLENLLEQVAGHSYHGRQRMNIAELTMVLDTLYQKWLSRLSLLYAGGLADWFSNLQISKGQCQNLARLGLRLDYTCRPVAKDPQERCDRYRHDLASIYFQAWRKLGYISPRPEQNPGRLTAFLSARGQLKRLVKQRKTIDAPAGNLRDFWLEEKPVAHGNILFAPNAVWCLKCQAYHLPPACQP